MSNRQPGAACFQKGRMRRGKKRNPLRAHPKEDTQQWIPANAFPSG